MFTNTPNFAHITKEDLQHIYEPAEDTFLLLDALEKDHDVLKDLRPSICLEVGCGSGLCSTFLGQLVGPSAFYVCTDINPKATEISRRTGEVNGVLLEPIITDLTSGLTDRLAGSVDVLLFNPPYVVTPSEEVGSHGIEASWAGGERGREVMDRIFPVVPKLLSAKGVFYLVIIKENDVGEIERLMLKQGLKMVVVISRRAGPEFLSILRFQRS